MGLETARPERVHGGEGELKEAVLCQTLVIMVVQGLCLGKLAKVKFYGDLPGRDGRYVDAVTAVAYKLACCLAQRLWCDAVPQSSAWVSRRAASGIQEVRMVERFAFVYLERAQTLHEEVLTHLLAVEPYGP